MFHRGLENALSSSIEATDLDAQLVLIELEVRVIPMWISAVAVNTHGY